MESTAYSRRRVLKKMGSAAAAAAFFPVLSACSSSSSTPESLAAVTDLGDASINAVVRGSFIPSFNQLTADLAARWEQERNATISLDLREDWRDAAAQIAQARSGPDLSLVTGNAPHLHSSRLVDVTDLAERIGEALGGWTSAARDTCVVDGVWRAIPWSTTRHALVVRTDLLLEVGAPFPTTYDDLIEAAVRLDDNGAPPIGLTMSDVAPADSAALAYGMLWAHGGQELTPDGRVALDSEGTRAALATFAQLSLVNAEGTFEWGHPDNNDAYLAGEIAITQNPSSIYLTALERNLPLAEHTHHIPLPTGPAGAFQLPEIDSLAVFRHSPDAVAAMDWIEFASQGPTLVDRESQSLAFHSPVVLGLDDDPRMPWNTDQQLEGLSSTAAEGRTAGWPLPPSLEAGLVYENNSIVNMFAAVGSGQMTARSAIAAATEELRRVYET